jgi:lipoate-protein ligase A
VVPPLAEPSRVTPPPFRHDSFVEPAERFHARELLADPTPRVVECRATDPALVLGSAQRRDVVDVDAAREHDVDVTRRRSGGGAVLVVPDEIVWFDVVVPADDARFAGAANDVTSSMRWLGSHVLAALRALGVGDVATHAGPMECSDWCRLICFAGIATGEVTVGGRKLVGVSQRRARQASRFQCAVHTVWSPDRLLALLAAPRPPVGALPPVATLDAGLARALPGALVRVLNAP